MKITEAPLPQLENSIYRNRPVFYWGNTSLLNKILVACYASREGKFFGTEAPLFVQYFYEANPDAVIVIRGERGLEENVVWHAIQEDKPLIIFSSRPIKDCVKRYKITEAMRDKILVIAIAEDISYNVERVKLLNLMLVELTRFLFIFNLNIVHSDTSHLYYSALMKDAFVWVYATKEMFSRRYHWDFTEAMYFTNFEMIKYLNFKESVHVTKD